MKKLILLFILLLQAAFAEERVGDLEAGKELFVDNCRRCHGRTGNVRALGRSRPLKTLTSEEALAHLNSFQLPHEVQGMQDRIKSSLTEQEIADLVEFIATLAE